jgi:hypothetical protein
MKTSHSTPQKMQLYSSHYKITVEWNAKNNEEFIVQKEALSKLATEHKQKFGSDNVHITYLNGKKALGEYFLDINCIVYYYLYTHHDHNEKMVNSMLHEVLQYFETKQIKFNITHDERVKMG